jgi:hypothetical protein
MSRKLEEGTKVRIATREEILKMGDMDIVTIHTKGGFLEVQGENSSNLTISDLNMGKVGIFERIDSNGDAMVVFDEQCIQHFPKELLIPVEDEVEKSDKKIIRFENVEPYFKLSDEQIKLLRILDDYDLLSESYNFVDEVTIIEV